jgi:hypothetical protein
MSSIKYLVSSIKTAAFFSTNGKYQRSRKYSGKAASQKP